MLGRKVLSILSLLLVLVMVPWGATPAAADGAVELRRADTGSLRLTLAPELGDSWRDVHVARLVLRTADGQTRLPLAGLRASAELELDPPAGCALLVADLAPATSAAASAKSPDAWQRATHAQKLVTCPPSGAPGAAEARIRATGALTGKMGGAVEIQPIFNPATVRPGSDMAVRVLVAGAPREAVRVTASGPGGLSFDDWSDPVGLASFTIPVSGRWTISFRQPVEALGEEAEASLTFDVEPAAFWDRYRRLVRGPAAAPASAPAPVERADGSGGVGAHAWHPLGPAPIADVGYTGRIAGLAVSATRPGSYVVAAATGGIWRTESGGESWQPLGDHLPTLALGSIAFDPSDERVIYVGSGEGHNAYHSPYGLGLYKSTDGGQSWRVLAPETFAGRAISRLAVSPVDPLSVWATVTPAGGSFGNYEAAKGHPDRAGPVGLFHSTDGGETWSHRVGTVPAIPASQVLFDPRNPQHLYVCFSDPFGDDANGVYQSRDGGATFRRILALNTFFGRTEIAFSDSGVPRIYALTSRSVFSIFDWGGFTPFGGQTLSVFRIDLDAAGQVVAFAGSQPGNIQGAQGIYNAAVAIHPADPQTVFLAGVQMIRSTDGGATWVQVTPPHPDVHQLAWDAAGRLVAATDGGVYRTSDLGESWETLNRNLGTVQFYPGLSVDSGTRGTIAAGTQDNGVLLSSDSGKSWRLAILADGGYTAFTPADPDVVYVEYQGAGNLFRSDDGGLSFQLLDLGIDPFLDVTAFQAPYQVDPTHPTRLLYATGRIFESTDLGDTWTPISVDITGGDLNSQLFAIRSLAIAPSNGQTVYATTNNQRLLVSTDGGATWSLTREGVDHWPRITRQIAVDPLDDATAYVAEAEFGGDGVLVTRDRGQTWTSIRGNLPDVPVNTVAVYHDGARRVVLAGTDRGVLATDDEGATWSPYGHGIPAAPVMDLVVDQPRHRLLAGTLGRGVWWTGLDG